MADLATHTSGLPFWPSNIPPNAEGVRLMSDYTVDQVYQFVAGFDVPADVGSRWAYSNMDAGLLGLVLARRANTSYEGMLETRVTAPLGMESTAIAVLPAMQSRLAVGHDKALAVAPRWSVPALVGAGSLHSTVNDLLTLLSATMGHVDSPLAPAFRSMLETQRKGPAFQQALGWWIFTNGRNPSHHARRRDERLRQSSRLRSQGEDRCRGVVQFSESHQRPDDTAAEQLLLDSRRIKPLSAEPVGAFYRNQRVAFEPIDRALVRISHA